MEHISIVMHEHQQETTKAHTSEIASSRGSRIVKMWLKLKLNSFIQIADLGFEEGENTNGK